MDRVRISISFKPFATDEEFTVTSTVFLCEEI